jgi:hypothetical protein
VFGDTIPIKTTVLPTHLKDLGLVSRVGVARQRTHGKDPIKIVFWHWFTFNQGEHGGFGWPYLANQIVKYFLRSLEW